MVGVSLLGIPRPANIRVLAAYIDRHMTSTIPASLRFGEFLAYQAHRAPDAPAVVFGQLRWTYKDLQQRVEECVRALIKQGVSKGDRIATLSTPRPEFLITYLAAVQIGAIWLGLNPVYQLDEYNHIVGDARPNVLFAFSHLKDRDYTRILEALRQEFPGIRFVLLDDSESPHSEYSKFLGEGASLPKISCRYGDLSESDPALLVYTSGSTGKPKGALLTQGNIGFSSRLYCDLWPLNPLRVIGILPITHVASGVETVAYALAAGGTIIFQEQFDAVEYLRAVEMEGVNWTPLVPTMFQRILEVHDWQRFNTRSLQVILFGGAAMPLDMIEDLKKLGTTVVNCWGMTETTSGVTFTSANDSLEIVSRSVGRAAPGVEIGIMSETGALVVPGDVGEIVVRGPCVFAGYLNHSAATRQVIDEEGWLHSGDLGMLDADGLLYIVGRIKEMFKSGGYNVYPREVENAIEAHPLVAMAVVVPVSDPVYQEVGYAYVQREIGQPLTAESIIRHCRERLANYKVPKRVFVRDSLPLLPNGKIDRSALQAEASSYTPA